MVNKKSIDDTHEWRKLEQFMEGDYIRGLGHEMLVTRVKTEYGITRLLYIHDKEEKILVDKAVAEYIGRKRE